MTAGVNRSRSASMLTFFAAKAAISALFAATFAIGYVAADLLLPDLSGYWHIASRIAFASAGASILPAGLAIATSATNVKSAELFREFDSLLVLITIGILPFLLVFAASILAALLLMNIRPETNAFVVPVTCCLCWCSWDRTVDQFLCSKFES